MSTYSDYEQRLLDQQSGEEMDRQAQRRERREARDTIATAPIPLASNPVSMLREVRQKMVAIPGCDCESCALVARVDATLAAHVETTAERWKERAEEAERILSHNMALANATTRRAMNERNDIIRKLRERHSAIEIADMVGLTRQRVHQIMNESPDEAAVVPSVKTSGKPECSTCRTELAFDGDVCGLCNPEVQP